MIYVMNNVAMPGMVKIGKTESPASLAARLRDLYTTSVPLPFECYFAAQVGDADALERKLHNLFGEFRVHPRREFFRVDPEKVVIAISIGVYQEVTPSGLIGDVEDQRALELEKCRRSRIDLEPLGIHVGDTLTLTRDESITATVLPGNKVDYRGETCSLSGAALKALEQLGYQSKAVSGSQYWMFDGETLDERRRRLEEERFGG
ncbi:GIY-YIG nuclease family protein [Acidithiobacillus caldus]|uniref:GIY-YIG nuclease family protein n=1 Tax=Acidithiobacillus caldus TaxID=33059 RepID=UPI0029C0C240|nr:GIY-YIG nuclease family protein [Acidithiobacillus caldus]